MDGRERLEDLRGEVGVGVRTEDADFERDRMEVEASSGCWRSRRRATKSRNGKFWGIEYDRARDLRAGIRALLVRFRQSLA